MAIPAAAPRGTTPAASISAMKDACEWLYRGLKENGVELAEAVGGRSGRLLEYVRSLSSGEPADQAITPAAANKALAAWAELWKASRFLAPVPDVGPADDGHLVFAWSRDEHYLELEVFQDGRCEMFYRNRSTGSLWSAEYHVGLDLPSEAVKKLELFTA